MAGLSAIPIFFVFVIGFQRAFGGIENYCSVNTFGDVGTGMHFTKEATNEEFAIAGRFKGLHCCAKGYRSIEWYKDGKVYPWELDLSRLIIFPESANQTIYTQSVKEDDEGNYTCVLRNDTVLHTHTINLKVFDKLPDDPKITYVTQDKEAYLGEKMRLFCEAFGGRIDLPDAHSEAIWRRQLSNGSLVAVSTRIQEEKISREEGQTFGTYLIFPEIKEEDFGTYICVISKPGNTVEKRVTVKEKVKVVEYIDPNPFPVKEVLFCSGIAFIVLLTLSILFHQYGLKIQVRLKDRFGTLEENDGKTHDVLVVYAPKDSEIVVGVLIPNLQNRFGYKCMSKELSSDISNWSSEISTPSQTARRIVPVISPAALNDTWASSNLYQALKQLQTLNSSNLICVALKELPLTQIEPKNSVGETLASLTRSMNIILWERSNDNKFWLSLCKKLPARRRGNTNMTQQNGGNKSRLNSESSLDSFVVNVV